MIAIKISNNMKVKNIRIKFRKFLISTKSLKRIENRVSDFASSDEKENWLR
jgi:hypothetical protein